jgi:hypothetical protein
LVIATIIPIRTNTTIAICIQIQVGDISRKPYFAGRRPPSRAQGARDYRGGMEHHLLRPAAAVVLMIGALAWLPAPAPARSQAVAHPATTAPLGGINIGGLESGSSPAEADRSIARARQLHVKIVRTAFPWSLLEPVEAHLLDPHALAFTDRLVSDAAAAGIRISLTVGSTPCWASSAPAALLSKCRPGVESMANAWPPRNAADYAALVAQLAQRYSSRLAAIEVWNEPDQANEAYFAGPNKPAAYTAVLRAAYPAIKRADPSLPVLGGSLVGSNGLFLRALYKAGMRGYYDGLSVHFYNLTLASLRAIHEVQLANGDLTPLWLDEFGWTSCWPRRRVEQQQGCVTARVQAENLKNTFRALSRSSYVAAAVVYKLQDSPREDFGVLSSSGAHKHSFSALAGVLSAPFGNAGSVSLSLRRQGSGILASGAGPVGDFMQLEAFAGSRLRYRALFTLDRFNRFSIRLPSVLGTSGLRVKVFQYWSGPGRAAQKSV